MAHIVVLSGARGPRDSHGHTCWYLWETHTIRDQNQGLVPAGKCPTTGVISPVLDKFSFLSLQCWSLHLQVKCTMTKPAPSPLGSLFWDRDIGATPSSAWKSLLVVLRGPSAVLGIKPGSATCKTNALPTILSLQSWGNILSSSIPQFL